MLTREAIEIERLERRMEELDGEVQELRREVAEMRKRQRDAAPVPPPGRIAPTAGAGG
jgi:prefoldin subunit 5